MFKIVRENLPQIEATVKAYGNCFVHGDGNLYVAKADSDFRRDYSNPDSPAKYRVEFKEGDHIPADVEAIKNAMMNNFAKERATEEAEQRKENRVKGIKVESQEQKVLPNAEEKEQEIGTPALDRYRKTLDGRATFLDTRAETLSEREAAIAREAKDLADQKAALMKQQKELDAKLALLNKPAEAAAELAPKTPTGQKAAPKP